MCILCYYLYIQHFIWPIITWIKSIFNDLSAGLSCRFMHLCRKKFNAEKKPVEKYRSKNKKSRQCQENQIRTFLCDMISWHLKIPPYFHKLWIYFTPPDNYWSLELSMLNIKKELFQASCLTCSGRYVGCCISTRTNRFAVHNPNSSKLP